MTGTIFLTCKITFAHTATFIPFSSRAIQGELPAKRATKHRFHLHQHHPHLQGIQTEAKPRQLGRQESRRNNLFPPFDAESKHQVLSALLARCLTESFWGAQGDTHLHSYAACNSTILSHFKICNM